MKRQPILIFLLFAAAAGTLVWVYLARRHAAAGPGAGLDRDTRRPGGLLPAQAHQGDAIRSLCRNRRPGTASRHRPGVPRDGRLGAGAGEQLRRGNRTAGRQLPSPGRVSVFVGVTDGNLERSLNYERRSLRERHGTEIDRALRRGNRYAARVLIWASAGDRRHVVMMEWCRSSPGAVGRNDAYLVCPTCGNLYSSRYRDFYCPCCQTDGRRFIRVE